jgi:hypothetical protein
MAKRPRCCVLHRLKRHSACSYGCNSQLTPTSSSYSPDYGMCSHAQPCHTRRVCGECERDPSCGWCPSTQQCTEGNSEGPLFGHCSDWQHGSEVGAACSRGPPHAKEEPSVVSKLPSKAAHRVVHAEAKQHDQWRPHQSSQQRQQQRQQQQHNTLPSTRVES